MPQQEEPDTGKKRNVKDTEVTFSDAWKNKRKSVE